MNSMIKSHWIKPVYFPRAEASLSEMWNFHKEKKKKEEVSYRTGHCCSWYESVVRWTLAYVVWVWQRLQQAIWTNGIVDLDSRQSCKPGISNIGRNGCRRVTCLGVFIAWWWSRHLHRRARGQDRLFEVDVWRICRRRWRPWIVRQWSCEWRYTWRYVSFRL